MYRFVIPILAVGSLAVAAPAQPDRSAPGGPFPALPEKEAWDRLPPRKKPALPAWAGVLAGPLPKTTAKLLELDDRHRVKNPLGPVFAAELRREAAAALGSEYGKAVAEADIQRGMSAAGGSLKPAALTPDGRIALAFAKKLTLAGHTITDDEFADLLKRFGPEKVTAIVHTVAYANFHNRILLGLGVKAEEPIAAPVGVAFDNDAAKVKAPDRPPWADLKAAGGDGLAVRVEWSRAEFDQLNATLDKQKERKLRIPLPDPEAIEKLPPRERDSAQKILWNTVSAGYQPELVRAWFAALYSFYEEAKVDRTVTNSMFWVVTRTNDCFY